MGSEFKIPIIWQDENILAINKPAGLLALPDGYDPTVVHVKEILAPEYGRLWIVHRLDRFTSGVMVLARSAADHRHLNTQFQERQVKKIYLALAHGDPVWDSLIVDQPLTTNKGRRNRTVVDLHGGKPSITHIQVHKRYGSCALVEAVPQTGRRHQIRVHLASLNHPIVCDSLYGSDKTLKFEDIFPTSADETHFSGPLLDRPALHARALELNHPATGERVVFEAPNPSDLQQSIDVLNAQTG
jgi:RluA family pseudouridine synthase